jgi:hypothetical protein
MCRNQIDFDSGFPQGAKHAGVVGPGCADTGKDERGSKVRAVRSFRARPAGFRSRRNGDVSFQASS